MRLVLLGAFASLFAGAAVGLLLTDLVVWRRTAPLRRARPPRLGGPPTSATRVRTSRVTWLAGVAGLGALGVGVVIVGRSWPVGVVMVGWGGVIAWTGIVWRVAGVEVAESGMTVRYGHRSPLTLAMADCTELRPPRTPLGGWAVVGTGGSATLMPSDLLGLEWILELVVLSSELEFRTGSWRNPALVVRGPPPAIRTG